MRQRCNNSNAANYHRYGGRGIKVCDRWNCEGGFENFVKDMGKRPSPKHTLDRIDCNGNYEPSNCRWANTKEQGNNKRTNTLITVGEQQYSIAMICEMFNLHRRRNRIYDLVSNGVDINFLITHDGMSFMKKSHREALHQHINFNRVVSDKVAELLKSN